jgi:hypothetical protein
MNNMTISNISYTPAELLQLCHKIKKPKFQRDKMWDIKPCKNNVKKNKKERANNEDYIKFLIKTKNSVFPISLGTYLRENSEYYIIIDGNNRLNAIISFFQCPYEIFPEYYDELFDCIDRINDDKINENVKENWKESIKLLSYRNLYTLSRCDNLIDDDIGISRTTSRMIDNVFMKLQSMLKFDDGSPYDMSIIININQFKNGTYKEYCNIFEDINKYSNTLSNNELLAATLSDVNINVNDQRLKMDLIDIIKKYYDNRGHDEVLETYTFESNYDMKITAYDFIVGLQNYCSNKYDIIDNFSSDGTSPFFKLFSYLYISIERDSFTDLNINDFIEKILYSCNVIKNVYDSIMPSNINDKIFNKNSKCNRKSLIAKNSSLVLMTSIIANKDKISDTELTKSIKKGVIYHLLCNKKYLSKLSDDEYIQIQSHDKLTYQAGGCYIDNLCNNILKNPTINIFNNLDKNIFEYLLNYNLMSSYNEKTYEDKKSSNKRKALSFFEKILISNYYNKKMPNCYIENEKYSIEHVTPFSSSWNSCMMIDIDRLGNLFPTLDDINRLRSNGNLNIYLNNDFGKFVEELLPHNNYSNINEKNGKKTTIINKNLYDEYCLNNEKLYIKTMIDDIFN